MGYKIDSNTLQVGKELEDKLAQLGLVIITDPMKMKKILKKTINKSSFYLLLFFIDDKISLVLR